MVKQCDFSQDGQIVPGFGDAGDRQFNTYESTETSAETSEVDNENANKRQRTQNNIFTSYKIVVK